MSRIKPDFAEYPSAFFLPESGIPKKCIFRCRRPSKPVMTLTVYQMVLFPMRSFKDPKGKITHRDIYLTKAVDWCIDKCGCLRNCPVPTARMGVNAVEWEGALPSLFSTDAADHWPRIVDILGGAGAKEPGTHTIIGSLDRLLSYTINAQAD